MIDAAGRIHNRASAEDIVTVSSKSRQPQSQSFGAELSDKLAKSSALRASATASQRIAPWRDPISTPGRTTPTSTTPTSTTPTTTPQPSGLNGLVLTYPSSTAAGTAGAAGAESTVQQPASQVMTFDQTYWASQPAAVQQLQDIQNPQQRTQVAEQLAQQGYSIDVPIMVWGWDPGTTTAARQSMGYTPGFLQRSSSQWKPHPESRSRVHRLIIPLTLQRVPSLFSPLFDRDVARLSEIQVAGRIISDHADRLIGPCLGVRRNLKGDNVNADQPWTVHCRNERYAAVVQSNEHGRNDSLVRNAGRTRCDGRYGLAQSSGIQLNVFASSRRIARAHLAAIGTNCYRIGFATVTCSEDSRSKGLNWNGQRSGPFVCDADC